MENGVNAGAINDRMLPDNGAEVREKYTDDMPERAEAFLSEGYSKRLVTIELGISEDTLWTWLEEDGKYYKSRLAESVKRGLRAGQQKYERIGEKLATGELKGNALAWLFIVKNKFYRDFRDKRELEVEGSISAIVMDSADDEEPSMGVDN